MDDVARLDVEVHRPALGQVELVRARPGRRRRPGGYSKVQANCWPVTLIAHLAGLGLLDVLEDEVRVGAEAEDHDRRDERPHDLEARVAVDRRPVLLLLARAHPELPDAVAGRRLDEHEDRDREDEQDVPERVDGVGLRRRRRREPVDGRPSTTPIAEAITPMTTSWTTDARSRWRSRSPAPVLPRAHGPRSYAYGPTGCNPIPASRPRKRGRAGSEACARRRRRCCGVARAIAGVRARPSGSAGGAARKSDGARRGGGGTPWRTGPAGGSRRGRRPRGP